MTDWEKCVAFHGHACGGLTIGFKAAQYAASLLGLTRSADEQVVCVAENDACGVDAIQALLGCTAGKGNLIFRVQGKQAFSFYERASGRSVRLVLRRGARRHDEGGVLPLLPVPHAGGALRREGGPAAGSRARAALPERRL